MKPEDSDAQTPGPRAHDPSFDRRIPEGDNRERAVCRHCGFIDYVNPKVIVGALARWEDRILICRRAIDPRDGYWTLPAGFMEENETTAEGAAREAYEEALAEIKIGPLIGIYNVPRISQVQIFYLARLLNPDTIAPGPESREVKLARWDEIPWDELAFSSITWALRCFERSRDSDDFVPFQYP